MKRKVSFICFADDYAPGYAEQHHALGAYTTAVAQKLDKYRGANIAFSSYVVKPTLRSALRFIDKAHRDTGFPFIAEIRERKPGKRVRCWRSAVPDSGKKGCQCH